MSLNSTVNPDNYAPHDGAALRIEAGAAPVREAGLFPPNKLLTKQLIVVDAGLPRLGVVLRELALEPSVLLIARYQDAIACISQALAHRQVQSLVMVAHGMPGEIRLGLGGLSHARLLARGTEIQAWGVASIQLFSSYTKAAGAVGDVVETLAQVSGATVYASEAMVANERLGRSWLRETRQGVVGAVPSSEGGSHQRPFNLEPFNLEPFNPEPLTLKPLTVEPLAVTATSARELPVLTGDVNAYALTIPDSVTAIEARAFSSVPLSSVTIPDSVTAIDHLAFFNTSLSSVTLPDSVVSIGKGAFAFTPLTAMTLGHSVVSIEAFAFAGTRLGSVTLPGSVTFIGNGVFAFTPLISVGMSCSGYGGGAA